LLDMSIPPANANPTTGVPPPPAPNPPFVAGIGPPIIHSNYAEFYADEGVHPRWSPSYAPLLAAMTILPSSTITGRDICQAIEKTQNVQYFTSIGLFGDPAQPTLSRIGVIHRLTYLSAPFLGGGGSRHPRQALRNCWRHQKRQPILPGCHPGRCPRCRRSYTYSVGPSFRGRPCQRYTCRDLRPVSRCWRRQSSRPNPRSMFRHSSSRLPHLQGDRPDSSRHHPSPQARIDCPSLSPPRTLAPMAAGGSNRQLRPHKTHPCFGPSPRRNQPHDDEKRQS
jgi:hypothetical protein